MQLPPSIIILNFGIFFILNIFRLCTSDGLTTNLFGCVWKLKDNVMSLMIIFWRYNINDDTCVLFYLLFLLLKISINPLSDVSFRLIFPHQFFLSLTILPIEIILIRIRICWCTVMLIWTRLWPMVRNLPGDSELFSSSLGWAVLRLWRRWLTWPSTLSFSRPASPT